jgi:hypothetical protein
MSTLPASAAPRFVGEGKVVGADTVFGAEDAAAGIRDWESTRIEPDEGDFAGGGITAGSALRPGGGGGADRGV